MDIFTIVFMIVISALINVLAWLAIGYIVGGYFAKYARCGKLCTEVAGVLGSLVGGFLTFTAYGLPETILWANNLIFALVGALGVVYISLPEAERSAKVEYVFRSFKRLNQLYIDLAGFKR
jgi:uncharacterized membrane protein YeaQ/YmgE (transglycosylase-associated protein family)